MNKYRRPRIVDTIGPDMDLDELLDSPYGRKYIEAFHEAGKESPSKQKKPESTLEEDLGGFIDP